MIFLRQLRAFASWREAFTQRREAAKERKAASSRRTPNLLLWFALLQGQIVSLDDYSVSGLQAVDDLDPIAGLDAGLYLPLLVAVILGYKNETLATVFEHGGLRP